MLLNSIGIENMPTCALMGPLWLRPRHLQQVVKTSLFLTVCQQRTQNNGHQALLYSEWETRPPRESAQELAETWCGIPDWPSTSCPSPRDWRGWAWIQLWRAMQSGDICSKSHHRGCFPVITSQAREASTDPSVGLICVLQSTVHTVDQHLT